MSMVTATILRMVIYLIAAPFVVGLFEGIDRKISARMQGRIGPSILQPFYDIRKLFNKEILEINRRQTFLIVSNLVCTLFTGCLFFGGFDMLIVVFGASTAAIFMILAASATHSPYAGVGIGRRLIENLCAEPMELMVAIGFYMASYFTLQGNQTFAIRALIHGDRAAIWLLPGFFVGFVFILTIKGHKSPFDLSTSHHAHQEIVKGITTEFTGPEFGLYTLSEWYEMAMLYGIVGLFFITDKPISILWAIIAIIVVFFLEILIDNTSARVKWPLMLKMTWGVILVGGGVNLIVLDMILRIGGQ